MTFVMTRFWEEWDVLPTMEEGCGNSIATASFSIWVYPCVEGRSREIAPTWLYASNNETNRDTLCILQAYTLCDSVHRTYCISLTVLEITNKEFVRITSTKSIGMTLVGFPVKDHRRMSMRMCQLSFTPRICTTNSVFLRYLCCILSHCPSAVPTYRL